MRRPAHLLGVYTQATCAAVTSAVWVSIVAAEARNGGSCQLDFGPSPRYSACRSTPDASTMRDAEVAVDSPGLPAQAADDTVPRVHEQRMRTAILVTALLVPFVGIAAATIRWSAGRIGATISGVVHDSVARSHSAARSCNWPRLNSGAPARNAVSDSLGRFSSPESWRAIHARLFPRQARLARSRSAAAPVAEGKLQRVVRVEHGSSRAHPLRGAMWVRDAGRLEHRCHPRRGSTARNAAAAAAEPCARNGSSCANCRRR